MPQKGTVSYGVRWMAAGQQVADALRSKIGSSPLQCDVRSRDQYGRSVAACRAGGQDINSWLVDSGFAVAYRCCVARKANTILNIHTHMGLYRSVPKIGI